MANNSSIGRLLAFGDVHGCTMQLDALWTAVKPTADDTIVFLGDYVDRGPDSKGVIDRLMEWRKTYKVICLRGNHELMMQRAKEDPEEKKLWMQVGGADCLASYSATPGRMGKMEDVPEEHWSFIEDSLADYFETDRAIFVHATVLPQLPLSEQQELELFWEQLTTPIQHFSGKIMICGHTAQKSGNILDLGSSICIDTCVYGTGKLTSLDVSTWQYWQADLLGRVKSDQLAAR